MSGGTTSKMKARGMVAKKGVVGPRPERNNAPVTSLRGRFGEHNLHRPAWPDGPIARAYLIALARWAAAHHTDDNATVMLPIGRVSAPELLKVLRALEAARRGRAATSAGQDLT